MRPIATVVGAGGFLLQALPQLGRGHARLLGGGQLFARLGKLVAAARQLLGGAVAFQGAANGPRPACEQETAHDASASAEHISSIEFFMVVPP